MLSPAVPEKLYRTFCPGRDTEIAEPTPATSVPVSSSDRATFPETRTPAGGMILTEYVPPMARTGRLILQRPPAVVGRHPTEAKEVPSGLNTARAVVELLVPT